MPKVKKKEEKDGKSVINESWDIEPIEDIDGFRKVVEHYSSETRKSAKKRGSLSGNKLLKRKKDTSIQLSNESEIKDFFEELISFLSRIPPLIVTGTGVGVKCVCPRDCLILTMLLSPLLKDQYISK